MTKNNRPIVAVFRPDDERMAVAVTFLEERGVEPLADPMIEIVPTGAAPDTDAAYIIFTSSTGVELALEAGWTPAAGSVVAIGPKTANALEAAGITVDLIPEEYSSSGLVTALAHDVAGKRVTIARSDHGSDVLPTGLESAGAHVTEIALYRLRRPSEAGRSTDLAAAGELDGAAFTSPLTVHHFIEAARDRDQLEATLHGLTNTVVGAIGSPTAEAVKSYDIEVDVVPAAAEFEALAVAVIAQID